MYMRHGFIRFLAIAFFSVPAFAAAADVYSVLDHGAVADGTTLNTEAIQSAINACAAGGGGTVHFPAGDYLSGTIFLKSHVRLNLDHGTRLLGSTNTDDYPPTVCRYPSRTDAYTVRALIWGEGLEDVAITGYGTIDGQGAAFRDNQPSEEELAELAKPFDAEGRYTPASRYAARPYLIRLVSCRDVLVENVRMRNSAMWMQHYLDCDFVTIRGINVYNHGCANNDMIDIDCCRNVIISDCFGDSDDDALTLKSTGDRPTEHVTITNCVLRSHCNAIKAGTESSGGFKDITISNCVLQNSSVGDHIAGRPEGLAGLALEIVDGGSLERVTVSNLVVKNTTAPIFLRLGNRARPSKPDLPTPPVGTFRDVYIDNVVATGASVTGCSITGLPGHPIENVSISNVRITFNGGGTDEDAQAVVAENEEQYPESTMFGTLPAYGFYCRHVDGLKFNNIDLAYSTPDKRPALVCDDVSNLAITSFNAQLAPDGPAQFVLGNVRDALIQGCVSASGSAFLQLTGSCESVAVMSNDLSRTTEPFDLRVGAESALYMANNRIKGGQSPFILPDRLPECSVEPKRKNDQ